MKPPKNKTGNTSQKDIISQLARLTTAIKSQTDELKKKKPPLRVEMVNKEKLFSLRNGIQILSVVIAVLAAVAARNANDISRQVITASEEQNKKQAEQDYQRFKAEVRPFLDANPIAIETIDGKDFLTISIRNLGKYPIIVRDIGAIPYIANNGKRPTIQEAIDLSLKLPNGMSRGEYLSVERYVSNTSPWVTKVPLLSFMTLKNDHPDHFYFACIIKYSNTIDNSKWEFNGMVRLIDPQRQSLLLHVEHLIIKNFPDTTSIDKPIK